MPRKTRETPQDRLEKLHEAAEKGDLSQVARLVANRSLLVDAQGQEGWSALHYASWNGNHDVVDWLLVCGADVALPNAVGRTPLHMAAFNGHSSVIQRLIEGGAKTNVVDRVGQQPLHYSARRGHRSCTAALLAHGAQVDALDMRGWTPLHLAAREGHESTSTILLAAGASTFILNDEGHSALRLANVAYRASSLANRLRRAQARPPSSLAADATVMHWAASVGDGSAIQDFSLFGASVDAQSSGDLPLHVAAKFGMESAIRALIEAGADPNALNECGHTPLMCCLHSDLDRRGKDTVEALLSNGGDAFLRDQRGETPLVAMARVGQTDAIGWLLDAGVDPNAMCVDGRCALGVAAAQGHSQAVKRLLLGGASPHLRDRRGRKPIDVASVADAHVYIAAWTPPTILLPLSRLAARACIRSPSDLRNDQGVQADARNAIGAEFGMLWTQAKECIRQQIEPEEEQIVESVSPQPSQFTAITIIAGVILVAAAIIVVKRR